MNLHEFQAKEVLAKFGVALPRGKVARNPSEAEAAARDLGGDLWVVKAQAHTGGRGKAGGVKVCKSVEDVGQAADAMIGMTLVTHQTGPAGKPVNSVYVEEGSDIARELYLAMLVDRGSGRLALIASTEGGMDIEEVAATTPEKILTITIDPAAGLQAHHGRRVAFALGLEGDQVKQAGAVVRGLYDAFTASDASLLEINPLIVTGAGDLLVVDCKFNVDDNAIFRHSDLAAMRDESQEDPTELEATKVGLNYVKLDGNIGCMVNGAGLAMATMDICKLAGGEPANFLDVGGGATKEQVAAAFKIIVSDPNVQAILVNIFGGIMRCDVIAEGIVAAARELDLKVPVVVRLEGTNVEKGKAILDESGLAITSADDLSDAAAKAVAAIKENG
jgi:succinyl-CoA synthetase beta subunit